MEGIQEVYEGNILMICGRDSRAFLSAPSCLVFEASFGTSLSPFSA